MKKSRLEKVEDFIFNYGWIFIVVLGILVIAVASIALMIYHNTPKPVEVSTANQSVVEEIISKIETNEEFESRYIEEIKEDKIFEIKLSDFENIHSEASLIFRSNNYIFDSSEMYGQGSKIVFNIIPPDNTIDKSQVNQMRDEIKNIVSSYGYDIEIILLVQSPDNKELVIYAV